MPQVKTEQRGNVTLRYYEPHNKAPDGSPMRVYLLPGVPTDIGSVATVPDLDANKIDSLVSTTFKPQDAQRATGIIESYKGRQVDAASILAYAEEKGKFDEFATKLEDKMRSDIHSVHPEARYARTDITAFMLGLFADLGVAPRSEAENMQRQVEEVGPGLVVLLSPNSAIRW